MKRTGFDFSKVLRVAMVLAPAAVLSLAGVAQSAWAQNAPPPAELHTLHVQGNVYMITGAGGNIAVQIGNDGVLLVDTGLEANADKVLAEVRKLSTAPIRYIINTHIHADHTGGNSKIAAAGAEIVGGNFAGQVGQGTGAVNGGAVIVGHENILNRMSAPPAAGQPAIPSSAWPQDTYFGNQKNMFFNGEAIELIHIPAAHTDGDTMVFFRRSDVIVSGDVYMTTGYPIIDLARGGNINGIIDALNRLIAVTIPAEKQEGGTYVIPGHGRLCDQADVVEYRDMATIVRDRVQDMVKKGMTLEQVKASRPTRDYDPEYGADKGTWTTEMFVDAVYKSLKK
jgi:glyoxylase-like metal-dependent hydrolase (beta-lactamase superfamily II)